MLSKSQRLTREEFEKVFELGKTVSAGDVYLKHRQADGDEKKAAVAVAKKEVRGVVQRNRARRRLYGVLEKLLPNLRDGQHVILFGRSTVLEMPFEELVSAVRGLMQKADLFVSRGG